MSESSTLSFNILCIAKDFISDVKDDIEVYEAQRNALMRLSEWFEEDNIEKSFVDNEIEAQDQALRFLHNRVARLEEAVSYLNSKSSDV